MKKRWLYVFPVALAALAVGVTQGLAGAGPTATNTLSPILNTDNCGVPAKVSTTGEVTVKREGDTLTGTVTVKKATTSNVYLYLYNGGDCGYITYLGKMKAGSSRPFSADVTGFKHGFIIYTYDDHYENSLIVTG